MRAFVIAGEPSGDALGAALMGGLQNLRPDVRFDGVGGPLMQARGLTSLFDMDELSVMGLAEIVPRYRALKRRMRQTVKAIIAARPDVLITIDSPEFTLRVARAVKAATGIRTVHYVAPSVWAWRPRRAEKMAGYIDQVLALFPFDPPLIRAAGVACDFVGHPIACAPQASEAQAAAFRLSHGLGDAPLLLVLPGSRRAEVTRLMPVFGPVVAQLSAARPGLRAILPAPKPVVGQVQALCADWPVKPLVLDPRELGDARWQSDKRAAFRAADVALAASGSVSLELAAAFTPMVIAYDMHWITRMALQKMLVTDTVTLVNKITERRTVPEFLGRDCRADLIAPALEEVFDHPMNQRGALVECMSVLGQGADDPGLRAAKAIMDGIKRAR
ncbi:MAG: lipid-A-disaccharide synthase [Pseudooceanicola sp.]